MQGTVLGRGLQVQVPLGAKHGPSFLASALLKASPPTVAWT